MKNEETIDFDLIEKTLEVSKVQVLVITGRLDLLPIKPFVYSLVEAKKAFYRTEDEKLRDIIMAKWFCLAITREDYLDLYDTVINTDFYPVVKARLDTLSLQDLEKANSYAEVHDVYKGLVKESFIVRTVIEKWAFFVSNNDEASSVLCIAMEDLTKVTRDIAEKCLPHITDENMLMLFWEDSEEGVFETMANVRRGDLCVKKIDQAKSISQVQEILMELEEDPYLEGLAVEKWTTLVSNHDEFCAVLDHDYDSNFLAEKLVLQGLKTAGDLDYFGTILDQSCSDYLRNLGMMKVFEFVSKAVEQSGAYDDVAELLKLVWEFDTFVGDYVLLSMALFTDDVSKLSEILDEVDVNSEVHDLILLRWIDVCKNKDELAEVMYFVDRGSQVWFKGIQKSIKLFAEE